MQRKHRVFISYAKKDTGGAEAIRQALEDADIPCWFAPTDIVGGVDWGEAVCLAIESSDVLLLVFSPQTNQSHMVKREVGHAARMGIPILPVRISPGEPEKGLDFYIGTHNWFEAHTELLDSYLPALVKSVRRLLSGAEKGKQSPERGLALHNLVVFLTKSQITELWVTGTGLELYLYDLTAGAARRQWALPPEKLREILAAAEVSVTPKSRYKTCGVFAVGPYRRWLYSKRLFPNPDELQSALEYIVQAAAAVGEGNAN